MGPSSGSGKLGITGIDRVRAMGSTADIVDATSLGAREVVDMARHYGRCYWELSKAKLRLVIIPFLFGISATHLINMITLMFTRFVISDSYDC